MKSLTATLLAEQKRARAKPYVRVQIRDRQGDQVRFAWSSLYSDASGNAAHAMVIAGDDSIVRVREEGGYAKYQRVTDPTVASQWQSWTSSGSTCRAGYQMALATSGQYVWWFYVSQSGYVLYCRESSDYGASWGSAVMVYTAGALERMESVAGAVQSGGEPVVFFSCGDPAGLQTDLYVCKRTGGSWGSPSGWGKTSLHRVRGLAVFKASGTDYNMLFAGEEAGMVLYVWNLWCCCYGDGVDQPAGTWADPLKLELTDEGTQYEYGWPALMLVDVYRALFICSFNGTNSYDRVHRMRAISGATYMTYEWTDPAPWRDETTGGGHYGACLAYRSGGDGYIYAATSQKAWRAKAAGADAVTFTERVKKYRLVDRWTGYKGGGVSIDLGQLVTPELYGELCLDNSDGELNTLGSGTYEAVKRGSQVIVNRGYVTSAGNEDSAWPYLWIEDYEYVVDFRGRSYLVLHLARQWNILSAMAARRQYHWAEDEDTVGGIAEHLFALAGIELVTAGEQSSELNTLKPWFVVHPGEDLRGAVLRVLSKVPDFVFFENAKGYAKELSASEASDYSYGGAGNQVIIAGKYGVRSPGHNHIEVFAGEDLFGDDLDYDEIDLVGHRLQKIFDYGYDSDAECGDRATGQLRKHEATTKRGELVTLPNVGLQLFDVVTVSDDRCGVSGELYRVRGIEEAYDTTKPPLIYTQTVILGAR